MNTDKGGSQRFNLKYKYAMELLRNTGLEHNIPPHQYKINWKIHVHVLSRQSPKICTVNFTMTLTLT